MFKYHKGYFQCIPSLQMGIFIIMIVLNVKYESLDPGYGQGKKESYTIKEASRILGPRITP
jgi:hypothetical protein